MVWNYVEAPKSESRSFGWLPGTDSESWCNKMFHFIRILYRVIFDETYIQIHKGLGAFSMWDMRHCTNCSFENDSSQGHRGRVVEVTVQSINIVSFGSVYSNPADVV